MLLYCQECTGVPLQNWTNSSMSVYTGACQLSGDGIVWGRMSKMVGDLEASAGSVTTNL